MTDIAITAAQPVLWSVFGYRFEAIPMLGALAACLMVRVWVSLTDVPARFVRWIVDIAVTSLAMMFTAGWVLLQRPEPFYALLGGTGFGALGAGIITLALVWIRSVTPFASPDHPTWARPRSRAAGDD